jgi:DNA-directed RNA polymerase specialized sigma24 family protein
MHPAQDDLDGAVEAMIDAMSPGGLGRLPREAHLVARRACVSEVRRTSARVVDAEDVADEAIVRFLARVATAQIDRDKSPAGYLVTITRNLARRLAVEEGAVELDRIEELPAAPPVVAVEDAEQLQTVMRRLHRRGDTRAVRALVAWLDVAYAGEEPTLRAVATYADMSTMSILRALRRAREVAASTDGSSDV